MLVGRNRVNATFLRIVWDFTKPEVLVTHFRSIVSCYISINLRLVKWFEWFYIRRCWWIANDEFTWSWYSAWIFDSDRSTLGRIIWARDSEYEFTPGFSDPRTLNSQDIPVLRCLILEADQLTFQNSKSSKIMMSIKNIRNLMNQHQNRIRCFHSSH